MDNSGRVKKPNVVKKASMTAETTALKRRVGEVAKGNNRVWEAAKVYRGGQESRFRVSIKDNRILKAVID